MPRREAGTSLRAAVLALPDRYRKVIYLHYYEGYSVEELAKLLHGQLASVNLIPINPVVERNLLRPSKARIDWFEGYLASHHVNVTVRREMGTDIQAACGQLRNKHLQDKK